MARLRRRRPTIKRRRPKRRRVVRSLRQRGRRSQKGGFLRGIIGSLIPLIAGMF